MYLDYSDVVCRILGQGELAELLLQNGADFSKVGPRNYDAVLNWAAKTGKKWQAFHGNYLSAKNWEHTFVLRQVVVRY